MQNINQRGSPRPPEGETGVVPILMLVAAVGMVSFLLISNTFDFKDKLFSQLFPKPASKAQENVKDKTLEILKLRNEHANVASSSKKQEILTNLINSAKQRKQELISLMEQDPGEVLKIVLPSNIKDTFPPEVKAYIEDQITAEGVYEPIHVHGADFKDTRFFYLRQSETSKINLHFSGSTPPIDLGTKVKMTGFKLDENMVVNGSNKNDIQIVSENNNVKGASTVKKMAIILVNFQNDTSQPISPDQARAYIFTDPDSTNNYYKEVSFNKVEFQGKSRADGDIFGWYTIPYNSNEVNPDAWKIAANSQAQAQGIDLTGYDQIGYFFSSCSCGFASGTTFTIDISESFLSLMKKNFNISESFSSMIKMISNHEIGHNLGGLGHAGTYTCTDSFGQRTAISGNCYVTGGIADPFDIMGMVPALKHFNNYHKKKYSFLDTTNVQTINTSGTYTIAPIEKLATESQILLVQKEINAQGTVFYYALEYRQPFGTYWDNFNPGDPVVSGVTIRVAVDDWWQFKNQDGSLPASDSVLLDTIPTTLTFTDAALLAGKTFYDPIANITVQTIGVDNQKATVQVRFSMPPCTRVNPTIVIFPLGQWGNPGQALNYSVKVTNNDTSECGASNFNVTPTLPSGFSQRPALFTTSINPGFSTTSTISLTSSIFATSGFYEFTETATNTGGTSYKSSASASYNVNSPPPDPTSTPVPSPTTPPATPTPTQPPGAVTLSSIQVSNITSSQATVSWTSNIPSTSRVTYGTSSSLTQSTTENTALVTNHNMILNGLNNNTRYYYRVISKNSVGVETQSSIQQFRTKNK